jgi:nucleotide-binding universal stress UspA family protein
MNSVQLKHVLVATDFSGPSATALQYGRDLARTFNATLLVLHVTDSLFAACGGETYALALPHLQRDIEQAAQRQVKTLLSEEDYTALEATAVAITAASKAEAIMAYARTHDIDVIVMGTHGRGTPGHLFMGSVVERVVRMAPCPVLTVHQPEEELLVPHSLVLAAASAQLCWASTAGAEPVAQVLGSAL